MIIKIFVGILILMLIAVISLFMYVCHKEIKRKNRIEDLMIENLKRRLNKENRNDTKI